MPAPRILPDNATLRRWVQDEGLTHEQVTQRVYETTGQKVARSTVAAALHRAGLTKKQARYEKELPWRVKPQHAAAYPARMLRDLGRLRQGGSLPEDEQARFQSWLAMIEDEQVVVAYDPDCVPGFFYVKADQPGDFPDGTPIRPGLSKYQP
jgi:hypothetical protein